MWAILTYSGLVKPFLLPTPTDVVVRMVEMLLYETTLLDISYTLIRLLFGFSIGTLLGVSIGILMGYFQRLYDSLEILVDFSRSVPVTALFPLFLLLFGIGDLAKVLISAWSSALIILINTMYGVRHSSRLRLTVAKIMKASKLQLFKTVICFT
jgi:NitT/TauT family transport system permease protein